MTVLSHPEFQGHELVEFVTDRASGLRAIIAIHSTALGPAGGGIRFFPYPDEEDAITDVLRLSAAMTAKMAIGEVPLGGGKAVILGDPRSDKSDALLEAFGDAVEALGGRYICGEDMGMGPDDMEVVARRTTYARGTASGSGDTSPLTAHTVFLAMRAAVRHRLGSDLDGVRVAVQGVGAVGSRLVAALMAAGASVLVADVDPAAAERSGGVVVGADEVLAADVDVIAPCAMGGILSAATIPSIAASIVCGAANNQLASTADADRLAEAGVLYVPDYVANIGGVYSAVIDRKGREVALAKAAAVEGRVTDLLARAAAQGISPATAADRRVAEILAAAS